MNNVHSRGQLEGGARLLSSCVSDQEVFPSLVMTAVDTWLVSRRIVKQIGIH